MAFRRPHVELDGRGHPQFVRRASSHSPSAPRPNSVYAQLLTAEESNALLTAQNDTLRSQLSFEQSQNWAKQGEIDRLTNDALQGRGMRQTLDQRDQEIASLERKLERAEEGKRRAEERLRLLRRGEGDRRDERRESGVYRERYEEKVQEVELLRIRIRDADDRRLAAEESLVRKQRVVDYLKRFLESQGFSVRDVGGMI